MMTVIAIGASALGTVQQMSAASDQADAQRANAARVDAANRYNARVQENKATQIRNKGVQAENAQRNKVATLIAKQRATTAANNNVVGIGSAANLTNDSAALGEIDAMQIKTNYQNDARAVLDQSKLDSYTASTKAASLRDNASITEAKGTSALLSGVGQLGGQAVDAGWFSPDSAAVQPTATNNAPRWV